MTDKNLMMSELHIFVHNPITKFIVSLGGGGLCFVLSVVHHVSGGRMSESKRRSGAKERIVT